MSNPYRFLAHQHLRTASEYQRVFQKKQRFSSQYFGMYYLKNHLDFSRIGIITSKRNVRFAVRRNTVRRIVREQFRLQQSSINGYDIVFVAYNTASGAQKAEIHQCIGMLLKKLAGRCKRP